METLKFNVQGSSPEPYEVILYLMDGNLSGSCTCPAGNQSKSCKHRVDLLGGNFKAVIEGNSSDLATALKWYGNSDIEKQVNEINSLENEAKSLKEKTEIAKKNLAKLFNR